MTRKIRSSKPGEAAFLNPRARATAKYLDIEDVVNNGAGAITCSSCATGSNAVGWNIPPAVLPDTDQLTPVIDTVKSLIPSLTPELPPTLSVDQDPLSGPPSPNSTPGAELEVISIPTPDFAADEDVIFTLDFRENSTEVELKPAKNLPQHQKAPDFSLGMNGRRGPSVGPSPAEAGYGPRRRGFASTKSNSSPT